MSIYTRTGDKGKTSLIGGKRVLKSNPRIETYGTIDELNSVLGVVVSNISGKSKKLEKDLERIQCDLFEIGAYLANPSGKPIKRLSERISDFEKEIDKQTTALPALRNFILPGGGMTGASLHQARTVCRRAERHVVALIQKENVDENVMKYLNRLSDLLFSTARYVNHTEQKKETVWVGQTE